MKKNSTAAKRRVHRPDVVERAAVAETLRSCRKTSPGKGRKWKSQEQLAAQLGDVASAAIGAWERGESSISPQDVKRLKRIFGQWSRTYSKIRGEMDVRAQMAPMLSGDELYNYLVDGAPSETDRRCWRKTNHSNPEIEFDELPAGNDEYEHVRHIVREHYAGRVVDPEYIARLRNVLDGQVYRFGPSADACVAIIKMVRRRRSEQLRRDLARAHGVIARHNIFGSRTAFLVPIATRNGENSVDRPGGGPITVIRLIPEAARNEATHFRGAGLEEIESVALKFGQVNNVLVDASVVGWGYREHSTDATRWEATLERLKPSPAMRKSTALQLAWRERDFIYQVRKELVDFVETQRRPPGGYPVSLMNLHPRNVFTRRNDGECLLIYDFEEVRTHYPEVANLTFSAHRFCREYIRQQSASERPKAAKEAALAFFRGYRSARPRAIVEEAVRCGTRWAKAVNFAKFVSNVEYEQSDSDPIGRLPEQRYEEVEKFIVYLKELDELHRWDWLSLVRQQLLEHE